MSRTKSKAIIMVADGAGGMAQLQDRRFEQGNWPVQFQVPAEQADNSAQRAADAAARAQAML